MVTNELLDYIVSGLDPEHIPLEYIIMVKYVDRYGKEHIVKGSELEKFMFERNSFDAQSAKVVLDTKKIKKTILSDVANVMQKVNDLYNDAE